MRLHKHFLPVDIYKASKELACFEDILQLVTSHVDNGDLELAKHRATDLLHSLHELSKLAEKKNSLDRHNFIVKQMQQAGVNVQIVRSMYGE